MTHNKHTGLSPAEVLRSREEHGANILTPAGSTPLWRLFLDKFRDPLIIILLVAGVLSVGISCYELFSLGEPTTVFFEPVGIFVAVMLATVLAFYFEMKADKEFQVLNQVNDDEPVEVIRQGNTTLVAKRDVVVGDIVILSTGQEVPADGRLLAATMLSIDESSLTGEPLCHKTTRPEEMNPDATFPSDHVMRGTKVMEGHGLMEVTAVGDMTENGRVFTAAQIDNSVKTPLTEQLDRLGRMIARVSYAIAAAVVVVRIAYFLFHMPQGTPLVSIFASILQTLMIAVSLIVVAVPEGLPMAVTLSLAYSMRRMLKTNNLVRKMHACETMGATTVICTDKTGTLTQNQMRVDTTLFLVSSPSAMDIISEGMAVNSTAELDRSGSQPTVIGNPTEGALLLWLHDRGTDYQLLRQQATVVSELPFSTERKFMATTVASAVTGKQTTYIKGAPEIVMDMCDTIAGSMSRDDISAWLLDCQSRGMRTLALAYTDDPQAINSTFHIPHSTLLGLVAIADPVRSDVPPAIKECISAGIDIKIVTGDTPATAAEIARQIGLLTINNEQLAINNCDTKSQLTNHKSQLTNHNSQIISGPDFAVLSDEELLERVDDIKVIARARPMDKRRLVEALQRKGEVVAVTGDGTNDAPALKAAHVGLSMGDGTAVAKEASDITIVDNSFASISRAVMWGRSLFQNIQRFLLFQLTVNVSACLIVLAGAFMGTEPPLTVTQMLWVNLIMDTFGAMALSSLPPSASVMADKPRDRRQFILSRDMQWEIIGVGATFFAMLLTILYIVEHADIRSVFELLSFGTMASDTALYAPHSSLHTVTPYEQTLLFSIFVWTHFWYMFCARAFKTGQSIFKTPMSSGFWTIVMVIVAGQLLITEVGYNFFNVVPLLHQGWEINPQGCLDLAVIILLSSLVVWLREIAHWAQQRWTH